MTGKKGFTLIEMLVVVAIFGILFSVVLVSLNTSRDRYSNNNYKIKHDGSSYYVESYTREPNCVYISEKELRICGDYTIKKLRNEDDE